MTGWKRSLRIPARLSRWLNFVHTTLQGWTQRSQRFYEAWFALSRARQRRSIRLSLEGLEIRELLSASFGGVDTATLVNDFAQLRQDLTTSTVALLNAAQPAQTNPTSLASLANQWLKSWNELTADWNQIWQDFARFEYATLGALYQQTGTPIHNMSLPLPGLVPSASPPAASGGDVLAASSLEPSAAAPPPAAVPSSGATLTPFTSPQLVTHQSVPFLMQSSECNCGCPNEPGSVLQPASPQNPPMPPQATPFPVRYADGVVTIAATDLHSDGFGFPWGQTRSWTNGPGYATGSDNGSGWVDTYTPHLLQADGSTSNTLIFIANGNTAYYYDLVNGAYQPRLDDGSKLSYNSTNDTFTLIDTSGNTITLNGFGTSRPTAQRGEFASFANPDGETLAVTSYTSDGHIGEMQRSETSNGNTTTESWLYSYLPTGNANAGLLSGVTLRTQVNGGAWSTVRQVQYAYYDGTQTYGGSLGDLMTATVLDGNNNALDTSYYRYYKSGEANGYAHGLKYVFNSDSYDRLTKALGTNLSNLTDAQVAPYADNYFQYDSSQRVTLETAAGAGDSQTGGGLGTYKFSYTTSGNANGVNSWHTKTVVTNPDGSIDTVYTNYVAEVMLDDHYDPGSGLHTDQFYEYNSQGQLILAAAPSAISGYSDSYADLLNNANG